MDSEASAHNILEQILDDEQAEPKALPISLLESITKDFSSDLHIGSGGFAEVYKGVLPKGETVAVKKLKLDKNDLDEKNYIREIGCLMKAKHNNIVRFLGYCANTDGIVFPHDGNLIMADQRQRLLCFEYAPNGSLDKFVTDVPGALAWRMRYKIIKGICVGLHYLHENNILHLDLKPGNILLDDNLVPKISDFGLSRQFRENQTQTLTANLRGTMGYVAPEFFRNAPIRKTMDIYSLGVIFAEILTGKKAEFLVEDVVEFWKNIFEATSSDNDDMLLKQVRVCAKIGMTCREIDPVKRPVMRSIVEQLYEAPEENSQELLNIYPFVLRFPFEPNKEISCPVNLTNKTDNEVHFSVIPSNPDWYGCVERLNGVVPPCSTLAFSVKTNKQQDRPKNMDLFRIIMHSGASHGEESVRAFFCDPSHESQATNREETINSNSIFGSVDSMDVHPTNPWIATGHSNGYICMWQMKAQRDTSNTSKKEHILSPGKLVIKNYERTRFMSVKFIPRTKCIISGDSFGFIHVYTYIENKLVEVESVKAHTSCITSLAAHPTRYRLLSCSDSQFNLWVWNEEDGWVVRDLKLSVGGHQVAFSPKDEGTFAIVSTNTIVKLKGAIDAYSTPPDVQYVDISSTCFDYGFLSRHSSYMAIGQEDGNTEILDEQSTKRIHGLKAANSGCVLAVACHPTLPVLVTGTSHGDIYLWSCTTYRLVQTFSFGHGKVIGIRFIDVEGFKRIVVGFPNIIELVEIDWSTLRHQL